MFGSRRRKRRRAAAFTPPVVTWRHAEYQAAIWMRALGFRDAQVTQSTNDRGIDVIATGGAAQVKWQTQRVGRPAVQALRGAAFAVPNPVFFSLGGYTRGAIEEANATGVALFGILNLQPVPVSNAAVRLAAKRPRGMRHRKGKHLIWAVTPPMHSLRPTPSAARPPSVPYRPRTSSSTRPTVPSPIHRLLARQPRVHQAATSLTSTRAEVARITHTIRGWWATWPTAQLSRARQWATSLISTRAEVARMSRTVRGWRTTWPTALLNGLLGAAVGLVASGMVVAVAEATAGPWEASQDMPDVVAVLGFVTWIGVGTAAWLWLLRRRVTIQQRDATGTTRPRDSARSLPVGEAAVNIDASQSALTKDGVGPSQATRPTPRHRSARARS